MSGGEVAVASESNGSRSCCVFMYMACKLHACGHGAFVLMCSDKQVRHAEGIHICPIYTARYAHSAIVTNMAALDDGAVTCVGF